MQTPNQLGCLGNFHSFFIAKAHPITTTATFCTSETGFHQLIFASFRWSNGELSDTATSLTRTKGAQKNRYQEVSLVTGYAKDGESYILLG